MHARHTRRRVNQKKDRDRLEEMETAILKNEENPGKRRQFWLPENETESLRCVKRRRRSRVASAAPVVCGESQNQSQSQKQQVDQIPAATTTKRSSRFRGVSRHRWTGRYEAHLWDKLSWNITQKKKGKQVYLGAYDDEESAARAYDLAALKYWGTSTFTNFPVSEYENEVKIMQPLTKEEYLASLRRKSSGFSRGVSKYRGVARHHHNGRWEARIGRVFGNKYLYLGTYSTQEEAARAYDIAAIEYRGNNAITNFDLSSYMRWLKPESDSENAEYEAQRGPVPENGTNYQQSVEFPSFSNDYSGSVYFNSNQKQDICQGSLNKSSSPTALSILLRSSMFRDLVEKNLHVSDDETSEEEHKIPASEEDECERIIAELFMV